MKTINFLKSTLVATLAVVALTLGFAACSDDDNNGSAPVTPKVKLLPTKMTEVEKDANGESTDVFTFEYNAKNQLVKITENEERELFPDTYTLEYGADSRISKCTYKNPSFTNVYTYAYDDTKGTVTLTRNGIKGDVIKIDKDGLNKDDEGDEENSYPWKATYEYDKYKNITKFVKSNYNTPSGDEKKVTTRTYGTVYSPYLSVAGLPGWFMFGEGPRLPVNQITGAHMPTLVKSVYTGIENDVQVGEEDTEIETISIIKEKNNYPTEIKVDYKEIYDSEEYTSTTTITIEYKEAI